MGYKVKRFSCGNGDGMYDHENGSWVEYSEYKKLINCIDELFDLSSDALGGLPLDELYKIIDKYNV